MLGLAKFASVHFDFVDRQIGFRTELGNGLPIDRNAPSGYQDFCSPATCYARMRKNLLQTFLRHRFAACLSWQPTAIRLLPHRRVAPVRTHAECFPPSHSRQAALVPQTL